MQQQNPILTFVIVLFPSFRDMTENRELCMMQQQNLVITVSL